MKKNSFLQGTLIASFAIIFIKILGALYVIPFYKIIGEQGGSLYSYAYNIYNLFLTISITGFPIAISKIVGEYNEKGMFDAKEKAFKLSKFIVLILGFITFLIVYLFSSEIATLFIGKLEGGNDISSISFVIKAISFSLLIIPYVSILRGYLQGHKYISPSTNSQIIEQILRIVVVLLGSYLAINVFNKDIKTGVAVALSGAFIGGLGALIYLNIKIRKNRKDFIKKDESNIFVSSKEIVKKHISIEILLNLLIGRSSELYKELYNKGIIHGQPSLDYEFGKTYAHVLITGQSKEPETLYNEFKEKVKKMKKKGISKGDFQRIKKMIYGGYVKEYNDVQDIARLFLADYFKGINSFDYIEEIEGINVEYLNQVLNDVFKEEKMVLSIVKS